VREQLDNLNQIYHEIRHNIQYFVELYKSAKAAGFRVEHIPRLLRIANNDLPLVDCKYENLKTAVKRLVHEIGGNKFLVEDRGTKIFLDFGMQVGKVNQYFAEFLHSHFFECSFMT